MDKFVIRGGNPLLGTIRVSGSKNSALPSMAAALLTEDEVVLENIPQVRDIETERKLLTAMGAEVELGYGRAQHRTTISCRTITDPTASYEIVKTMRASSLVLGPLVARMGVARVSMPGGCAIGARPIDLHTRGLEMLGAKISYEHGYIEARAERLKGAHIVFDKITVTGTEDLLMAATLAEGETVMENCAREPEVTDLAALLTAMGAQIHGAGTSTIRVKGVDKLHGARHRIHPDRIEASTFLVAGAITGGDLCVAHCNPEHLTAVMGKLRECGARVEVIARDQIRVRSDGALQGGGYFDGGVSGISHGHAGAVHGAGDAGGRDVDGKGKYLRKPVHARAGAGADGREHPRGRARGHGARADSAVGCGGDVLGPAGVGIAGAGGAGGGWRVNSGSRVQHRSRLRAH